MGTLSKVKLEDLALVRSLAELARPLTGSDADFDPLLNRIEDAHFALIGEASHGTHEFYRLRAQLTKRLIQEKGFRAVAIEGDWPDAYRVNRYVRGIGKDKDAEEALAGFRRFPAWMWRNADVLDFVGWLRAYNDQIGDPRQKVGFYGLDLYSLHASIEAVLGYLDKTNPEAARRARARYACFEHFGEDPQQYGFTTSFGIAPGCENEAVSQLVEMQRQHDVLLRRDGLAAEDELFQAEQNARVVKDAEAYYRAMFGDHVSSWNLRDRHMADILDALVLHLGRHDKDVKVAVWAHNSHVGDARATQMGKGGEWNIGQLTRERHPADSVLIGFSTYSGTVTAASNWDQPSERKRVRFGLPGSFEELFHNTGLERFLLTLWNLSPAAAEALREPRLQRAIGVVYKPETERMSHYFYSHLPEQFDAVLHLDQTRALEPLERTVRWETGEVPETYPTGI
jgi:erythromycin esterase-like protein